MKVTKKLAIVFASMIVSAAGSSLMAAEGAVMDELPGDGGDAKKKCNGDKCEATTQEYSCVDGKAYYSITTGQLLGCSTSGTGSACCIGAAG